MRLALVALAVIVLCPSAHAFHSGSLFDSPAGAGGGGGLFYTGSPRERRWDCSACHVDAEHRVRLEVVSDPPELFEASRYVPGQAYAVTVRLVGEHRGLDVPRANFNGVALSFLDAAQAPAGRASGYSSEDLFDGGSALVTAGKKVGVTEWSLTWTAPAAGAGAVGLYACVVDGDGASAPQETLTDPWNDDLACGALSLVEGPATARKTKKARSLRGQRTGGEDGQDRITWARGDARALGARGRLWRGDARRPVPEGDLRGRKRRRRDE